MMKHKTANLSKEGLELVQKAEKKLAELGREIILIAYIMHNPPEGKAFRGVIFMAEYAKVS